MATLSSILAWRIPWTEVPGGLQSMGLQWISPDWATNTHHSLQCLGEPLPCNSLPTKITRPRVTFTFHFHALEEEMAAHSSVLAWRIPGTREPGGLSSMGSHRVRHDWSNLAAAAAAAAASIALNLRNLVLRAVEWLITFVLKLASDNQCLTTYQY